MLELAARNRPCSQWRELLLLGFVFLTVDAGPAHAHIKWFKPFDINQRPLPIGEVLNKTFILLFITSVVLIYIFFLADRYAYKKGILVAFDDRLRVFDGLSVAIMRAAACIFFVSLWAYGVFAEMPFYITPELVTGAAWVPWLQLAMAACALTARTTPVIGIGILILYVGGLVEYGLFHMLDYVVFLAIGFFFFATAFPSRVMEEGRLRHALRRHRRQLPLAGHREVRLPELDLPAAWRSIRTC